MSNFSWEWDEAYRGNTHLSIWPWSDLVSYFYRFARPSSAGCRLLELGPGAGANIPLFQHLNVDYSAVEGSPSIVAALHARFPEYREGIKAGDFIDQIPFAAGFDVVVDRSSLTCNNVAAIRKCLSNLHALLKPGGLILGIDWFSTRHDEFRNGEADDDRYTRTRYATGQFAGLGRVHFTDEAHLRDLFADFELLVLEEKVIESVLPAPKTFATWNLVARKSTG